ncbi:aminoacyl-tRNA hydrolase [Microgenomates group bacterium RBG_16_45_19]|nr:MAG: aminoacyl-tRNA hydrolase [Microgenomates group bacterium RBG_16_45_19]
MKLVVGLGNPGEAYNNTRHNVGFWGVDALKTKITKNQDTSTKQISNFKFQRKFKAEMVQVGGVMLVKPQTFMNLSGQSVRAVADYYRIEVNDIWVIHDDLDIKLGEYKIQLGKGPKVHNGVASVEQSLGTNKFWRVRVGIENRIKNQESRIMNGEQYVLLLFGNEEKIVIEKTVKKVAEEIYDRII